MHFTPPPRRQSRRGCFLFSELKQSFVNCILCMRELFSPRKRELIAYGNRCGNIKNSSLTQGVCLAIHERSQRSIHDGFAVNSRKPPAFNSLQRAFLLFVSLPPTIPPRRRPAFSNTPEPFSRQPKYYSVFWAGSASHPFRPQ